MAKTIHIAFSQACSLRSKRGKAIAPACGAPLGEPIHSAGRPALCERAMSGARGSADADPFGTRELAQRPKITLLPAAAAVQQYSQWDGPLLAESL